MSFQQGLSGLNANSKALQTVGNNIANSSTVGYKAGSTAFADVFAASFGGTNQIGVGASVAAVNQQFSQGTVTVSNNPLDMAISGYGFFRMSSNGTISWTRNGQFEIDKDGYVVNTTGGRLTGYLRDATTNTIVPSTPDVIQIDTSDLQPLATGASANLTGLEVGLNLDSREAVNAAVFSENNPTTYNWSSSMTAFDSLGNSHLLTVYFKKTAANTWDIYNKLDSQAAVAATPAQIVFNTNGSLITPANGVLAQSWALTNGATSPLAFPLNLTGSTQYGNTFGVNSIRQDGYTSGRLSGIAVAADGTLQGRYTNGQSRDLAQVVLGNFANPNGLLSMSGNQWGETAESGQPLVGVPGSASLGLIQSAAIEESNVDLTEALVSMITIQRAYQANAQTIKTQDQIMQTLVNLR